MQPDGADSVAISATLVQPAQREPFWGYVDLLMVIGLLCASTAIIGIIASMFVFAVPSLREDQRPLMLPAQLALYGCVYLCFLATFKLRYDRPVFASLGWRRTSFNLFVAAVGGVLLAFGLSALAAVVHTPKVDSPFEQLANTPLSLIVLGITAVAIAPVFEELFFRGFLQPLLSRTFGAIAGVLITAILFGSLHAFEYMNVWQYVAAVTIVGIALGVLRAWTNSIIPGTIMHGCFNAVSVLALAISKYAPHK
jgi:uncharacterized protein